MLSKIIIGLQPLFGLLNIHTKSALCPTSMLLQTFKNGTDEKPPCDVCVAHLQHGQITQWKISEACDVEEGDLICTIGRVSASQLHRLPQVAHILPVPLVPHIVLVALGDHQIPRIIRAHIQAGDDSFGQAPRSTCTSFVFNTKNRKDWLQH